MKKIFSILLALALVLSFAAVATPVSADQYAELAANITDPAHGDDFMGGDQFTVTANVTNNGNAKAQDVTATIDISGNATLKAVAGKRGCCLFPHNRCCFFFAAIVKQGCRE